MKPIALSSAILFAGAVCLGGMASAEDRPIAALASQRLPDEGPLPSFAGATTWLNAPPLSPAALRGKVVVVDFWTYSCINWLRTLPYTRAWADKYRDQGLVVIGVHSPEFEFEKDLANVGQAAKDMRVGYPIAVDSGHAIWRAFHNEYWPARYIVDAQGRIRHHHFGEGDYAGSEKIIQQLLAEAGAKSVPQGVVSVDARGTEAPPDLDSLRSAENYVGYGRTEGFASRGGIVSDRSHVYAVPARMTVDDWALSGDWTIHGERIVANQSGARIVYRFHARDLHLVMGPSTRGTPVRFRIRIDGQPPGADHGLDVDEKGNGTLTGQRLYQLVRQRRTVADRQFEIEFVDPGAEAYSFTFG